MSFQINLKTGLPQEMCISTKQAGGISTILLKVFSSSLIKVKYKSQDMHHNQLYITPLLTQYNLNANI